MTEVNYARVGIFAILSIFRCYISFSLFRCFLVDPSGVELVATMVREEVTVQLPVGNARKDSMAFSVR